MDPVVISSAIVSVLLVISRFVQAAKPVWDRLPKAVAVIIPAAVALVPAVADQLGQTKSSVDLVSNVVAAVGLVVVGLFPKKAQASS